MSRTFAFLRAINVGGHTVTNAVFERALGVRGTTRGFSTLQRLAAKHLKA